MLIFRVDPLYIRFSMHFVVVSHFLRSIKWISGFGADVRAAEQMNSLADRLTKSAAEPLHRTPLYEGRRAEG